MIVRVRTPKGDKGQVCGFAAVPGRHTGHSASKYVLVAIEGKAGDGKLEVYAPSALKVVCVELEYGD